MGSTLTHLLYHIVFSTKDRVPVLVPQLCEELYPYIGGLIRGEKGKLIKIGGGEDHLHLLTQFSPTLSIAEMLQRIKACSSKWINAANQMRFGWQRGYSAFSVSLSASEAVSKYIENQLGHHRKTTYKEELIALLEKHQVEYDERYLWD